MPAYLPHFPFTRHTLVDPLIYLSSLVFLSLQLRHSLLTLSHFPFSYSRAHPPRASNATRPSCSCPRLCIVPVSPFFHPLSFPYGTPHSDPTRLDEWRYPEYWCQEKCEGWTSVLFIVFY
jgi:hypothetical protein